MTSQKSANPLSQLVSGRDPTSSCALRSPFENDFDSNDYEDYTVHELRHDEISNSSRNNESFGASKRNEDDDYQEVGECNQLIGAPNQGEPSHRGGSKACRCNETHRGATFADVIMSYFSGETRRPNVQSACGVHNLPTSNFFRFPKVPPTTMQASHHRSHVSSMRPILLILLCLVLIACAVTLLMKLSSLVNETKFRLQDTADLLSLKHDQLNQIHSRLDEAHRKQLEVDQLSRWLVSSSKCHIPFLEPWDQSIGEYVTRKRRLSCSKVMGDFYRSAKELLVSQVSTTTNSLSYVEANKLHFVPAAIRMGALSGLCCYKSISRSTENDDELDYADECVAIRTNALAINSTLIEVSCGKPLNYLNVHSFVIQNMEEEDALARVADAKLNSADYYNVLMVGVDTMSRSNGQRQLNRTLDLLKGELYRTLDFAGYNKVGENTFPNLIPLLTGLRPEQLAETQCWMVSNYTDEGEHGDDYLDNCKYLWNFYQQLGYATYFSEDWPSASTFNYLKPGFKNEPTNFYGRPFALARDKLTFPKFESIGCASCQLDEPIVQVDLRNLQTFIEQHRKKPYFAFHWINCPQHDDLNGASQMDHILRDFFERLHNLTQADRTFVFLFSDHGYRWNNFVSTRIGHYESSLPLLTIAPPEVFIRKHPDLYQHLKEHQSALLTPFDLFKTLIGIRDLSSSSRFRAAERARARRLARQAPKLPEKPIAPTSNQAISSPLNESTPPARPAELAVASISELRMLDGVSFEQKFRPLSLLDQHSPEQLDRSCIDAGIPDNYCVCHQFQPIHTNRLDALGAAYYLVYIHLEARLRDHLNICRQLELDKVHQAELFDFEQMPSTESKTISRRRRRRRRRMATGSDDGLSTSSSTERAKQPTSANETRSEEDNKFNYLPNREYSIMFSTRPGGGLFQEVVRYYGTNITECEQAVESSMGIMGDKWARMEDKQAGARMMNSVCEFSVHSESISRFNLYKDQSKCVKSNIELKKICYCNDLL